MNNSVIGLRQVAILSVGITQCRIRPLLATSPGRARVHCGPLVAVLLVSVMVHSHRAEAQAFVPLKGEGTCSLTIQDVTVKDHINYLGDRVSAGRIDSTSLYFRLDYGLTDRLAITAGIPYTQSKYDGTLAHDPSPYPDHEDEAVIDDGSYHGGWQDYSLGLRYNASTGPLVVTPFVALTYPSHGYTYFAHSAIGTRQWQLSVGADMARQLPAPLDMFYVQGGYGYSIKETVQDISVRSSKINLELGYLVNPRLTARLLTVWQRSHNGLDFPIDFPPPPAELRFDHDRVQRVNYWDAGAGLSYQMNDRYALYGTWMTFLEGRNGHAIDNAFTLGIGWSFSRASQIY